MAERSSSGAIHYQSKSTATFTACCVCANASFRQSSDGPKVVTECDRQPASIKIDSEKRGSWASGRRAMPERHRRDWLRLSVQFGIEPCDGLTELILVLHADRNGFASVHHRSVMP